MKGTDSRSREHLVLVLLLIVGALLRGGYLVERQAAPDFERPVIDAGFHDDWARCLAFGSEGAAEWRPARVDDPGFETEPYLRPPGYPFFLAGAYRIGGGRPLVAAALQILLGLASIVMTWLVARRFGTLSGAIAGGVMATHWALIYFEGELLAPALIIALQLGMVLALIRSAAMGDQAGGQTGGRGMALFAGVLLGLGVLTRPNVLAQLAVCVPWLVIVARRRHRPALAPALLFVLGTVLAIAPATIRNLCVSGEPVLVTANLGVNLWIGNHDGADGRITDDLGEMGRFKTCYDWSKVRENVEREVGRDLSASEVSAWFTGRAVDWMTSNPGAFLGLTLRKAALFWGPEEISNNKDVAAEKRFSSVLRWLPLPFPLLAFGAFAGLGLYVAMRRRADGPGGDEGARDEVVVLIAGLAFVTFLSLLPFFATARFRVPLVPFLALLAGLLPALRRVTTIGQFASFGVAGCLVGLAWFGAPAVPQSDQRFHLDRGRALYNQVVEGTPVAERDVLYAEARRELDLALEIGGGSAPARFEIGVLEQRIGDLPAARERYLACLERDPRHAPAHFNLGFVYEGLGKPRLAIRSFASAAEADPAMGAAAFEQGRLLASIGRIGPAIAALRTAHARDPRSPRVTQVLARYLVGSDDPALRDIAEGVRLAELLPVDGPAAPAYEETRARAYAAADRAEDADRAMERALALAREAGVPPREIARLGAVRRALAAGTPPWRIR